MDPLSFLLGKKSVALLTHINPDWDTYGSSLALREALRGRGVKCDIIVEEPLSVHLDFLATDVTVYDENEKYDYECVCAVDVSTKERLGKRAALFDKAPSTACIDHHFSSENFSPVSLVVPEAGATAEVVYDLCAANSVEITKSMSEFLYCALSSDTGSFRFSNTTAHTAEVLGGIISSGCDVAKMANCLYFRDTLSQIKLRAAAANAIELYANGKVAVCCISDEMISSCGEPVPDASALSDVPRSVCTVEVSAVLREEAGGKIKVSLRSKTDANVERIAASFGGGGHIKAAGATVEGTLSEAREKLLPLLEKAVESV